METGSEICISDSFLIGTFYTGCCDILGMVRVGYLIVNGNQYLEVGVGQKFPPLDTVINWKKQLRTF